jgi:hypothetical protein
MKKREEMLRELHRRMDEYESDRRTKRTKVTKVAASVTPVCAAAVVGVGLWKGGVFISNHEQLISSTVESTASDVTLPSDKDKSADKYSTNNKNNTDKKVKIVTAAITADRQATTSDAIIPHATETSKTINNSAEVNVPTSDSTTITNNDSQNTTEAHAVQTEATVQQTIPPVRHTEPAIQGALAEQANPNTGNHYMWCIVGSSIEWNGQTYHDSDTPNVSAYTQNKYIGNVSDFTGVYGTDIKYRISPDDSVYTVKETDDVLFVVKADTTSPYGVIIVMCNSNWSIEKYESERISPDYNDASDESSSIYFGFRQ